MHIRDEITRAEKHRDTEERKVVAMAKGTEESSGRNSAHSGLGHKVKKQWRVIIVRKRGWVQSFEERRTAMVANRAQRRCDHKGKQRKETVHKEKDKQRGAEGRQSQLTGDSVQEQKTAQGENTQ